MNLLIFNLKTDADDSVLGFTTDWINALAAHCNRVIVITMMAGRIAVSDNVRVYSVGKEKGHSELRRLVEFYRLLVSVLRQEKIDACFAHMMPLFAVMGWPLLKPLRIPIVLWYTHSHVPPILRLATFLVDRVVSAGPSGFRIPTDKVSFIGHGIDVDRFSLRKPRTGESNKLVLITVGRLSPVKKIETLLQALALLPDQIKQKLEFRCIGDPTGDKGPCYAQELSRLVGSLGLIDVVRFEPAQPFHRVQESYQSADIFINTSDTDSIDKTVLEAMSCGLPVLTSNIAFIEVFGNQLANDCHIPKNDTSLLAESLNRLINMKEEERVALGLLLREIVVKHHSLNSLAYRILSQLNG